jgi:hypothetical protein
MSFFRRIRPLGRSDTRVELLFSAHTVKRHRLRRACRIEHSRRDSGLTLSTAPTHTTDTLTHHIRHGHGQSRTLHTSVEMVLQHWVGHRTDRGAQSTRRHARSHSTLLSQSSTNSIHGTLVSTWTLMCDLSHLSSVRCCVISSSLASCVLGCSTRMDLTPPTRRRRRRAASRSGSAPSRYRAAPATAQGPHAEHPRPSPRKPPTTPGRSPPAAGCDPSGSSR